MKRNATDKFWDWLLESLRGWGCLENSFFPDGRPARAVPRRHERRRNGRETFGSLTGIGLLVFALASAAAGQDLKENQRWIEQVDGGVVFPASSANSAGYGAGIGGDILVGYRFSREFSLSGDLGYYDCDQKTSGAAAGEWIYTPIMAVARLNIGTGWIRPYLLLGVGAAFNTYSLTPGASGIKTSQRETDLLASPGAGLLFVVASNAAVYLQGRLDINFTPAGGAGNPFTDSPSLFIPVKAGVSFFAL